MHMNINKRIRLKEKKFLRVFQILIKIFYIKNKKNNNIIKENELY